MRTIIIAFLAVAAAAAAEPELVNGTWVIPKKEKPAAQQAAADVAPAAPAKAAHETPSDIMAGSDAAAQAEKERHEKAVAEIEQQRLARLGAWAAHARLDAVKVPSLPADPRDSDRAAVRDAGLLNETLSVMRSAMSDGHLDGTDLGRVVVEQWIRLKAARLTPLLDDR